MCAMPEKKKQPIHEDFIHHFDELQNDMLNIQQILKQREKIGASFDTIAKELEALKEDAEDRIFNMEDLYKDNTNLFPKNTKQILHQCRKLIETIHPEYLTQEKWAFNENYLKDFKKSLGY